MMMPSHSRHPGPPICSLPTRSSTMCYKGWTVNVSCALQFLPTVSFCDGLHLLQKKLLWWGMGTTVPLGLKGVICLCLWGEILSQRDPVTSSSSSFQGF